MKEELQRVKSCLEKAAMNATNHVKSETTNDNEDDEEEEKEKRTYLMLDDYDCIGFDLDHTLCRYNLGPMIR